MNVNRLFLMKSVVGQQADLEMDSYILLATNEGSAAMEHSE